MPYFISFLTVWIKNVLLIYPPNRVARKCQLPCPLRSRTTTCSGKLSLNPEPLHLSSVKVSIIKLAVAGQLALASEKFKVLLILECSHLYSIFSPGLKTHLHSTDSYQPSDQEDPLTVINPMTRDCAGCGCGLITVVYRLIVPLITRRLVPLSP